MGGYNLTKYSDELWVGYCGTLGASYDLTCVIDALAELGERGIKTPKFVVFGDGPRRKEFEERAQYKGIDAVFTGRLEYPQMCGGLSACDIAVNPITHNAAQSIINKHGDYAAAGLPVINTQECQEYKNLVESYYMGVNSKNNNIEDMASKLQYLIEHPGERKQMGLNARRCAEEKFDRQISYKKLFLVITKE